MSIAQKKYLTIVKELEREHKSFEPEDEENCKKLMMGLHAKLKQEFKQQISFDATICRVMMKRIDDQFRDFYYDETFVQTQAFVQKLVRLLHKEKFIGERHVRQISAKILSYKNDPCYVYYNFLCYLRRAVDQEEFRYDFLDKYMNMKDEEEYEDWEDEDYKKTYRSFFKRLFTLNPKPRLVTYIFSCFSKFEDPKAMLTEEIIETVNAYIGEDLGSSEVEIQLNKELRSLAFQNFYEHSSDAREKINKEYELVESLLHRFAGTKKMEEEGLQLQLAKFGSLISGFAGTDTDLDITIMTSSYVNENNFLQYLAEFLKIQFSQHDQKTGRKTEVHKVDATTPLVQIDIKDLRRETRFKIDILVNNLLGVINSKLLSVYAQIPWIKQLGILFKLWAKTNGVISTELLSSYATILMMLHFLIQKKYVSIMYNAKSRNTTTPKINFKRMKNGYDKPDQFDVYYEFKTNPEEVTNVKNVNLVGILKELFLYYSDEGEHWKKNQGRNIISIDGTYDKDFDNDTVFTIKDPFDKPHNPGRARIVNKTYLLDRFKEGYNSMESLMGKVKKESRTALMSHVFEKS